MRSQSGWMRGLRAAAVTAVTAGALVLAAFTSCTADVHLGASDSLGRVALQAVSPASGATGVSLTVPITMRFSDPMGRGMESHVLVHEGVVTGPIVAGRWSWSDDRRTLTFTPGAPLKPHTTYVVHVGGGMRGMDGAQLDYGSCLGLGGRWVSAGMMAGEWPDMMGPGWRDGDGGYGTIFTFTTA